MVYDNCRNIQFGYDIFLIFFTEVIGHVPQSRLCQFVKLHLLVPKSLHALLYRFRYSAHHPAGFIIFAQCVQLCIFIIFPILFIVWTHKIAQTSSNRIQHLLKYLTDLPGCQSPAFNTSHIFLLLLNSCLCILNSLSCHSSFCRQVILDPCLSLFVIRKVHFSSSLCWKLHLGLQAAQCTSGLDLFSFQATLAFIRLMALFCESVGQFAALARWMWGTILFQSIDHCS